MTWNWFDLAFPWIGLGAAGVLLVLLLGTRRLQGDPAAPRWRDRTWLSWMAVVAYLVHNVEEYGCDALGHWHSFPDHFSHRVGLPAYPDNPIPSMYWVAINITLVWVAAPLAAVLSRRHPVVGLAVYSVVFVNGLLHLVPFAMGQGYNPGVLTAAAIFLPLSAWVGHACFGRGRLGYPVMGLLVAHGVLLHAILMATTLLFVRGAIDGTTLVLLQVANGGVLLALPWCAERWRGGVLAQPLRN